MAIKINNLLTVPSQTQSKSSLSVYLRMEEQHKDSLDYVDLYIRILYVYRLKLQVDGKN